jgi:ABC-type lipoprotein release transport system permease subunit
MVMRQNMALITAGLALGIILAVPTTRLMRGLLYQVEPNDPTTFVAIAVLLASVGGLAAYLPARMGTRLDPVQTLRAD